MKTFISIAEKEAEQIKKLSRYSKSRYPVGGAYPISWKIDSSKTTTLNFKGYTGTLVSSKVTHSDRILTSPLLKKLHTKIITCRIKKLGFLKVTSFLKVGGES